MAGSERGGGRLLPAAGVTLGLGLGGFVDGIVFHQLLQWHHMLSGMEEHPPGTVAGLQTNTFWDGLFHASTWVLVVVGVVLLWRAAAVGSRPWRWPVLLGFGLVGWGLFNLVEGTVNHFVLGIHNVRNDVDDTLPWDLAFLAAGAALVAVGLVVARRAGWGAEPDL